MDAVTAERLGLRWLEPCIPHMCDYGAARVAEGKFDAVEFNVMPCEVAELRAYMAAKHPTVSYRVRA